MKKIKRYLSQEKKLKIVNMVLKDNLTVRQVTDMTDIERQTIHRWINEYKEFGEKAFLDKSYKTQAQEIRAMKKKIKELEEKNEILKKTQQFFAMQKRKKDT